VRQNILGALYFWASVGAAFSPTAEFTAYVEAALSYTTFFFNGYHHLKKR
jgi:uncharacterized membrane protein